MNGRGGGAGPLFPRRTVVVGTFVPTVLMEIAISAVAPVIVARSTSLGATLAAAGILTALPAIGQILVDLPAGSLAARIGDRGAMLLAAVLGIVCFAGAAFAPTVLTLGLVLLASGASAAVFHLARHSYLTEVTPALQRGRVLTTLAGVHRLGAFLGPFLGAAAIGLWGVRAVFLLAAAVCLLAFLVLLAVGPDDRSPGARAEARERRRHGDPDEPSMLAVLRSRGRILATLGIGVFLLAAVRGVRQTVLPLWGEHLGLDPATVSLVVGIAAGLDMLVFYPSGMVMDAFGRMWVGIPGALAMGVTVAALPFTQTLVPFVVVGLALGAANGWSSGILMTLGSDTAPERGRSKYLGAWRVVQDSGTAVGPLVVAGLAGAVSLAAGIWVAALTGLGAALAFWRWVPRYSEHATNATRSAAGIAVRRRRGRRR